MKAIFENIANNIDFYILLSTKVDLISDSVKNVKKCVIFTGRPDYAVMRILGGFQNFYAVIFIMRICGYPHNFVS